MNENKCTAIYTLYSHSNTAIMTKQPLFINNIAISIVEEKY